MRWGTRATPSPIGDPLRQKLLQDGHEFRHGLFGPSGLNSIDDAASGMVLQQDQAYAIQCRANRRDLRKHLRAVAILLDHVANAAHLALYTTHSAK